VARSHRPAGDLSTCSADVARRWTPSEDELLLDLYAAGVPRDELGRRLGRTIDAVDARRRLLDRPARSRSPRPWSETEERFLRAAADAGVPGGEIARRLGRTPAAVRRRRELLGATRPRPRRYTPAEDALIAAAVAGGASLAPLAERLGRSEGAVRLRARSLGLVAAGKRQRWTSAEDDALREAYAAGRSTQAIREVLPHRTAGAIVARAHLLGLAEHARRWSGEDDRALVALAGLGVALAYVGARLGRTEEAVAKRCRLLGLPVPPGAPPSRRGHWTEAEDAELQARADEPPRALVASLGRSEAAIRRRRRLLGLAPAGRTQHHPLPSGVPVHALARAVEAELPLTPARALALSRRLGIPLAEVRRLARRALVRRAA
jgi:hypothetical protein